MASCSSVPKLPKVRSGRGVWFSKVLGHADNKGFIDVRFMLPKRTYEERIFHTLMQRDRTA